MTGKGSVQAILGAAVLMFAVAFAGCASLGINTPSAQSLASNKTFMGTATGTLLGAGGGALVGAALAGAPGVGAGVGALIGAGTGWVLAQTSEKQQYALTDAQAQLDREQHEIEETRHELYETRHQMDEQANNDRNTNNNYQANEGANH
jgi:TolA-binding protein